MQPTNAEAIFYFKFVLAAYAMYESDPDNLTPPGQNFPDQDYQIAAYITSVDPLSGTRVFFGFLAVAPKHTATKPLILALRGTDNDYEWFTDAYAIPTPFKRFPGSYVATGFDEFVNGIVWLSPLAQVVDTPVELKGASTPLDVIFTGHSLGGAMTTLLAAINLADNPKAKLKIVTAASPAVGDGTFAAQFNTIAAGKSYRFINDGDIIASVLDPIYTQTAKGIQLWSDDILPTPACEHSLYTYIYLLSPAGTPCTSSCCFFDMEAKRRMQLVRGQKRSAARASVTA